MPEQRQPKNNLVSEHIRAKINGGYYPAGFQIPTETELADQFGISRQTVGRALRELTQEGLVFRRRGAGTFVSQPDPRGTGSLGAIIPYADDGNAGSELYLQMTSHLCLQMTFAARNIGFNLQLANLLGGISETIARKPEEACAEFTRDSVAGVFFWPLGFPPGSGGNNRIAHVFEQMGIPVVLLDSDVCDYPQRSKFDLVGVDNRRGGYLLASHLWGLGCRRIEFVATDWQQSSVVDRIAGYQELLLHEGVAPDPDWVHRGDRGQPEFVRELAQHSQAEAFICTNDWTAAILMRALVSQGRRVPQDVRVVGFDNINIASMLSVALTTINQPMEQLAVTAVQTMAERLADPGRPPRHIMLDCQLVVRESCGSPAIAANLPQV